MHTYNSYIILLFAFKHTYPAIIIHDDVDSHNYMGFGICNIFV